jgi:hypothetical protein
MPRHAAALAAAAAVALAALAGGLGAAAAPATPASRLPHHLRNRAGAARSVADPRIRARHAALMRSWATPAHLSAPPDAAWVISPITYGADPTGRTDSTAAFAAAIAALLARNTSGHADESGTVDLGGATLDLGGGDYLISAPVAVPSNYSNYAIAHGTLRASPSFPPASYLVEVGSQGAPCTNW